VPQMDFYLKRNKAHKQLEKPFQKVLMLLKLLQMLLKQQNHQLGKGLTTALSGAGGAKGVASKVSGVIGKAGVLGSAALGGMDLYEDIKGGGIQGNNNWEKASNLLQIGGTWRFSRNSISTS
jgi:hypothetical protein